MTASVALTIGRAFGTQLSRKIFQSHGFMSNGGRHSAQHNGSKTPAEVVVGSVFMDDSLTKN